MLRKQGKDRVDIERRFVRTSRLVKRATKEFATVIITVAFIGVPIFG